eukprot:CAMPEP_0184293120 /NCGR_PEP_ID=MMETSP1049-20130417/4680_1 /TAXON_ID=77928 /ORGANISM="Proteomonas sulcata, Strain CCMP704" /LENGTH=78 /DNA_ID=CAMNT_0026601051 /DNA_START=10 /DNA_END=246 /DNA_ORIENTATION=-
MAFLKLFSPEPTAPQPRTQLLQTSQGQAGDTKVLPTTMLKVVKHTTVDCGITPAKCVHQPYSQGWLSEKSDVTGPVPI